MAKKKKQVSKALKASPKKSKPKAPPCLVKDKFVIVDVEGRAALTGEVYDSYAEAKLACNACAPDGESVAQASKHFATSHGFDDFGAHVMRIDLKESAVPYRQAVSNEKKELGQSVRAVKIEYTKASQDWTLVKKSLLKSIAAAELALKRFNKKYGAKQ